MKKARPPVLFSIILLIIPTAVSAQKPDLEIGTTVTPSSPSYQGETVPILRVDVWNKGQAPASPIEVRAFCRKINSIPGRRSNPALYDAPFPSNYTPLQPGQKISVEQAVMPGTDRGEWELGEYELTITVDPGDKVSESDETDNSKVFRIRVNPPLVSMELTAVPFTGICPIRDTTIATLKIRMVRGKGPVIWKFLVHWDGKPLQEGNPHTIYMERGQTEEKHLVTATSQSAKGTLRAKITSPTEQLSDTVALTVNCLNKVRK